MCVFLLTRHRLMGYRTDPVGSASPSSSHALRNAGLGFSACKGVVIGWHCYEQVNAMRFFFTWYENRWSGVQWLQGTCHRVAPFLKRVNAINSSSLHVLVWVNPDKEPVIAWHLFSRASRCYMFFFFFVFWPSTRARNSSSCGTFSQASQCYKFFFTRAGLGSTRAKSLSSCGTPALGSTL